MKYNKMVSELALAGCRNILLRKISTRRHHLIMADLTAKYRPQALDQVLGHVAIIKSLQGVLDKKQKRAFIFAGPPGVGKTTLAKIVGKMIDCHEQNFIEVNGADSTGIDDMRRLLENVNFSVLGGGTRVYFIDEAQRLSKNAWDLLLKPTEVPPKGVYFIFSTTELHRIPEPFRVQRCVTYELSSISGDDIYDYIKQISGMEKFTVSDEVLSLIARRCDGSPRRALTCLGQLYACQDVKEAASVLVTIDEEGDIKGLIDLLLKGQLDWPRALAVLKPLKDEPAEGLRIVIMNYLTKVLMGQEDPAKAASMLNTLQAFQYPYPEGAKVASVLMSVGQLIFTGN